MYYDLSWEYILCQVIWPTSDTHIDQSLCNLWNLNHVNYDKYLHSKTLQLSSIKYSLFWNKLFFWNSIDCRYRPNFKFPLSKINLFYLIKSQKYKLTWCQCLLVPEGSFFHLFTKSTHALHISPARLSLILKQFSKSHSYRLLSVKRELDDFARHIQQPLLLL